MTTVYMRHIREARLCAGGARLFFQTHGLNWSEFLSDGISAEALRGTGSDLCERVIVIAEREQAG